jgi:hypothetical protein
VYSPAVAEFHAVVSIRGEALSLLGLREGFRVNGAPPVHQTPLVAGQQIDLAEGVSLSVVSVQQPVRTLMLRIDEGHEVDVYGVVSLVGGSPPEFVGGWRDVAMCRVFSDGEAWFYDVGEETFPIVDGGGWTMGRVRVGARFRCVGTATTQMDPMAHSPLVIRGQYDTVVFEVESRPPVVLSGLGARLISELIAVGGTANWSTLAHLVWRGLPPHTLRRRWDVQLARIRRWLRTNGVRDDLLQMTGSGDIRLVELPGDVVRDEA